MTLNDTLDPDSGPNNLQNFPVVTFASFQLVQGTLHSKAHTTYRIEAFASGCHSSGYGPGHVPLGVIDITTDANGNASFSLVPNNNNFTVGTSATATAMELVSGVPRSTSEFSACQTIVDCPPITVNPAT